MLQYNLFLETGAFMFNFKEIQHFIDIKITDFGKSRTLPEIPPQIPGVKLYLVP